MKILAKQDESKLVQVFNELNTEIAHCYQKIETNWNIGTGLQERAFLQQNIIHLVQWLHQNNDLPALVFNFSRRFCNSLMLTVFSYLKQNSIKLWKSAVDEQRSIFVFCPFESLIFSFLIFDFILRAKREIEESIESLESISSIPDEYFDALRYGVAVHHSGMKDSYLREVEKLFRMKCLLLVIATGLYFLTRSFTLCCIDPHSENFCLFYFGILGTLTYGIHMPCKTVVISGTSPFLNPLAFHQMSGRAGRRGFEMIGKVIFFGVPQPIMVRLMSAETPKILGRMPLTTTHVLRLMNLLSGLCFDLDNLLNFSVSKSIVEILLFLLRHFDVKRKTERRKQKAERRISERLSPSLKTSTLLSRKKSSNQ
jgi:superfamily II RNA helicase